jgi:hypothetical protein
MKGGTPYKAPDWQYKTILAIPVTLCMTVAFFGQLGWIHDHLKWGWPGQITMALALESIALFFAWQSYNSEMANDSALKSKIAAYAMGLLVGWLNYSHYAKAFEYPNGIAIITGMMSTISPWLASSWSRRVSRNLLASKGLIEGHALRLGTTRWLWHPIRSAKVMFNATWEGQTIPIKAITTYDAKREKQMEMREMESNMRAIEQAPAKEIETP